MAFTTIDINTSWQDIAIAEEIRDAYNMLAKFLGQPQIHVALTTDVEVLDFVYDLQTVLTAAATRAYAVNPSTSFNHIAVGGSYPSTYGSLGLNQLYADVSMASGFRRIAGTTPPTVWTSYSDAAYSYGKIVAGDMAGPWLFVDLQNMLNGLTTFKRPAQRTHYKGVTTSGGANSDLSIHHDSAVLAPDPDDWEPGDDWGTSPPDTAIDYWDEYPPAGDLSYVAQSPTPTPDPVGEIDAYIRVRGYWSDIVGASDWIWAWHCEHQVFGIRAEPISGSSSVTKLVTVYGRVTQMASTDAQWSVPFGFTGVSAGETKYFSQRIVYSDNYGIGPSNTQELFGDEEFTAMTDIFPARPTTGDLDYYIGSKLTAVICRVVFTF